MTEEKESRGSGRGAILAKLVPEQTQKNIAAFEEELRVFNTIQQNPLMREFALNKLESLWQPLLGFNKAAIVNFAHLLQDPEYKQAKPKQTSFTLKEMLACSNQGNSWLVPLLLQKGGALHLLAGQAKTGKSLLSVYSLAYALTVSGQFLGFPCEKGMRVLIVQVEESNSTVGERLEDVGFDTFNQEAQEVIEGGLIRIEKNWSILDLATLRQWIEEFGPDLIIFDSLRGITATLNVPENVAAFAAPVYVLQKFLIHLGVTGLLLHHAVKDNGQKGNDIVASTSALPGATDGIARLSRDKKEPDLLHLETSPRKGPPIHYIIKRRIDPLTDYCGYEKVEEVALDEEKAYFERKIMLLLSRRQGQVVAKKEIAEFLEASILNEKLADVLSKLKDSCQISRVKQPDSSAAAGFTLGYMIPETSLWVKLYGEDALMSEEEREAANKFARCQTADDVIRLKAEWLSIHGEGFSNKIYQLLGPREQKHIFALVKPFVFKPGDIVKQLDTDPAVFHTIESASPHLHKAIWIYKTEGGETFKEDELVADLEAQSRQAALATEDEF